MLTALWLSHRLFVLHVRTIGVPTLARLLRKGRGRSTVRYTRSALVILALLSLLPLAVGAQGSAESNVDVLLDRVAADINDLEYAEAIRRGQSLAISATAMSTAHRVRWRLLMAAAFFPEDPNLQHGDSAMRHLEAAVRLQPDARYDPAMRWRGLDSLLDRSRARTLGVALRPTPLQHADGADAPARITVIATHPTRFRLNLVDRATDETVHADTATGDSAVFAIPAHDGRRVILAPGTYVLEMTAVDAGVAARTVRHEVTVRGTLPKLEAEPELNESSLLPEFVAVPRRRAILTGLAFSGATLAIASMGRSDGALADRFDTDARAYAVSAAMLVGVTAVLWKQKGAPLPQNAVANSTTRSRHQRELDGVIASNRALLRGYRPEVSVSVEPEVER